MPKPHLYSPSLTQQNTNVNNSKSVSEDLKNNFTKSALLNNNVNNSSSNQQQSPSGHSFYGNRYSPYGNSSKHSHLGGGSIKSQQSSGSSLLEATAACDQHQLNTAAAAAAAANLMMQNSAAPFNPFSPEAFFNSYLPSNMINAANMSQNQKNINFNLPIAAAAAASKMASSIQQTLNQYPLANSLLNNSAFKNVAASLSNLGVNSFLNSSSCSAVNVSSASSGYSSNSDETFQHSTNSSSSENNGKEALQNSNLINDCDNIKQEKTTKVEQQQLNFANSNKLNSSASLAHIMNWIKSAPSTENFNEITSRILYSALKWTKTQRNFINLPLNDQFLLINESLSELFILQMAENKLSLNDGNSI